MKFAIGIPTLNRVDLLYPSVLLYKKDFPDAQIYILDNGNQDTTALSKLVNVHVLKNETNIGVAASWNMLCGLIFEKHPYALILNDDIYLGKRQDDVQSFFEKKKHKAALLRPSIDWCAFVLPKSVFEKVGKFDECFYPAYYEDRSYEYRMKLLGVPMIKTPFLNPYVYRFGQSMEKSPDIQDAGLKNKELYIQMWGGEPEREKFKIPYDGLVKSL